MQKKWCSVRSIAPDDLATVHVLEQEGMDSPWSESQLGDELNCPISVHLLASRETEILGYIFYRYISPEAELLRIGVAADWRRFGVGQYLFLEGQQRLISLGVDTCFLEVRRSNHGAREFYSRMGFHQVGIRKNYYENPVEDALLFQIRM